MLLASQLGLSLSRKVSSRSRRQGHNRRCLNPDRTRWIAVPAVLHATLGQAFANELPDFRIGESDGAEVGMLDLPEIQGKGFALVHLPFALNCVKSEAQHAVSVR